MAEYIEFTKMHGAGNDYIYVNTLRYPIQNPEELSRKWSAPHTGIGSDGLVLIGPSDKADFSMRIFNADGSEAKMCGNASRCIGKYLYEYGMTTQTRISLETLSGIKILQLHVKGESVDTVSVDMGIPGLEPVDYDGNGMKEMIEQQIDIAGGVHFRGTAISMGNPHVVIFTDDVMGVHLPVVGPQIENHPFFPDRINVEFAQVLPDGQIRMRVWERGSGITQACGTGACATAVAACLTHRSGTSSTIIMDGGSLRIEWDKDGDGHLLMTGGAVRVFDGRIEL